MESGKKKQRLDEILVEQGQISDEQIKIALKHQKIHGGKFGSHILHHGFIDEAGLVRALAEQFGCPGVALSNLNIPEEVLSLVPRSLAVARKIIPFNWDAEKNVLQVACEDPGDPDLLKELSYILPGKTIELCVAVEIALNFAISRHYGKEVESAEPAPAVHDESVKALKEAMSEETATPARKEGSRRRALIVTDARDGNVQLRLLLEDDGFEVALAGSVEKAMQCLNQHEFDAVLIRNSVDGDHALLAEHIRACAQSTKLLSFENASDLLLPHSVGTEVDAALRQNLELFTSLLTIQDRVPNNQSSKAGEYVNKLCGRLAVSPHDRMYILNAAYLHERAKFYYMSAPPRDFHGLMNLTIKLLESVYYEPVVIEILRSMYIDLRRKYGHRLPIEILGGNILTIVDMYCGSVPAGQRVTLDRFDLIRQRFQELVGELFLTEVVSAFIDLINDEIVNSPMFSRLGQIMMYSDGAEAGGQLEEKLMQEGFRTIRAGDVESFVQLYRRSQPDILVLQLHGPQRDVIATVNDLADEGVDFKTIPTFLFVESTTIAHLTSLLVRGIEDIVNCEAGVDLLALKVKKAWTRMEVKVSQTDVASQQKVGSTGSLSDMNLIDLLQALGPSRRTTKITVTSSASGETLEIYLDQGNIIFAQVDDLRGAEAIYLAMTWEEGTWTVEPLKEGEIREPNNELSNEAILMEGCRLKDEITSKLFRA